MIEENITKSFHFGVKVKFAEKSKFAIYSYLMDKEFCLIGFNESAFALIEWSKRGQYNFECYKGSVYSHLEVLSKA